jgi:hypothetical protein
MNYTLYQSPLEKFAEGLAFQQKRKTTLFTMWKKTKLIEIYTYDLCTLYARNHK